VVMISEHPAATVLYLSLREGIRVRRTNAQANGCESGALTAYRAVASPRVD